MIVLLFGLLASVYMVGYFYVVPEEEYDELVTEKIQEYGLNERYTRIHYKNHPLNMYSIESDIDPSRPYIVCLHGIFSSSFNFLDFVRVFSNQYNVIALDIPGWGTSDPYPIEHMTDTVYTEFIVRVLKLYIDARGIGKCHLVAYSLATRFIHFFGETYPERIHTIILMNPPGLFPICYPHNKFTTILLRTAITSYLFRLVFWWLYPLLTWLNVSLSLRYDLCMQVMSYTNWHIPSKFMGWNRWYTPWIESLINVRVPTYVLNGDQDIFVPHTHGKLATHLSDKHVHSIVLEGSGHNLNAHPTFYETVKGILQSERSRFLSIDVPRRELPICLSKYSFGWTNGKRILTEMYDILTH